MYEFIYYSNENPGKYLLDVPNIIGTVGCILFLKN